MNEDFERDIMGDEFEEDLWPSVQSLANIIIEDKPFGMVWPEETMVEFLKKLDYRIVVSESTFDGYPIRIAVKKSDSVVPDLEDSNISSVFSREIQSILLNWLLKIK